MTPARIRFMSAVETQMGKPSLWAAKGPDAFDCSGLVTYCLWRIGGPDWRANHNSQALHDVTRPLSKTNAKDVPLMGDLAFYGSDARSISHVTIVDSFGGVVSADGATSHITRLDVAMSNPANRVRRHGSVLYRHDLPFVVVHRFTQLDDMEMVTR